MDSRNEYTSESIGKDQPRVDDARLEKLMLEGLDSGTPIQIENLDTYFAQKKSALLSAHQPG